MKVVRTETLLSCGSFPLSASWERIRTDVSDAITRVVWPPGSSTFTIYPESGKRRGEGNGVKPIKNDFICHLVEHGWTAECALDLATVTTPGDLDAVLETPHGAFALEWETGNISSSHRALNKMALGLLKRKLVGGTLIVPSRKLYPFLTDRIGNFAELAPYLDLWRSVPCTEGVLQIIVVEHDAESRDVPKIPKGTDGRSGG